MTDDKELFGVMRRELFTAVIGDILDTLGFLHQFLPPNIQPLRDDMVVLGRAMTVLGADYLQVGGADSQNDVGKKPFGLMFEALDDLKPNEVYVTTGGTPNYALWGELMSTRALKLGSTGAVLDGYARDTNGILQLNFPTFAQGRYAQDQGPRGKVIDFRVPVKIGDVLIQPGDIVFGDIDGVVVIPRAVEQDAIERALDKVRKENLVKAALEEGMSTVEAFRKYGVM
jgi:4-hydroxy-4-methyl-2-oxoglutarate aldolase